MKFPKTPEDIVNEIYISSDKSSTHGDLRIRQLLYLLSEVADSVLVEAVMQVFEGNKRMEASFLDQGIAGHILKERKPLTTIYPEKLIKRCLVGWNKSIEQFPFWLVKIYSVENIQAALTAIENEELLEIEREKLATMRWWIQDIKPAK